MEPNVSGAGIIRAWAILALVLGAGLGLGCEDNQGDTIVIDGLDCGLVRGDLLGDWAVSFVTGSSDLENCDGAVPGASTSVDVLGTPATYFDVTVFASPSSSSFLVRSDGPNGLADELIASVEADSCLALVQLWENDDSGWIQCFGTLDRIGGMIHGFCDSVDFDTDADREAEVACDLVDTLEVDILIP